MNKVKQIVQRDDSIISTTEEALMVIREYIKARKGLDVNLAITSIHGLQIALQIYPFTVGWFRENIEYFNGDGE
jgi:hypothetical protein